MFCPECKYDLQERNSGRCPECGLELSEDFLNYSKKQKAGIVLWAVRLAALSALGISVYLSWLTLSGAAAAGCGCQGGCNSVLQSKWSHWISIPVSLPGAGVFAMVFLGSILADPRMRMSVRRFGWEVMIFCSSIAGWAAVWFMAVQFYLVEEFCPYCITTHSFGVITTVMIIPRALWRPVIEPLVGETVEQATRRAYTIGLILAAGIVVGISALTQYMDGGG